MRVFVVLAPTTDLLPRLVPAELTDRRTARTDALRMDWRRAAAAGIATELGCHSFRETGIAVYLQNGGLLEHAQQMAARDRAHHETLRSPERQDHAR